MNDPENTLLTLAEKTITYGSKLADHIELLIRNSFEIGCEINLGQMSKALKSQDAGASIRCVLGNQRGSAFTNRIDEATLQQTVKRAIAAAKASTADNTWKSFPQPTKYSPLTGTWDDAILEAEPGVFVDMTTEMGEKVKKQDSSIILADVGTGSFYGWSAYANSNGVSITDRGTGVYAYTALVAPTHSGMTPQVWTADVSRTLKLDLDFVVETTVRDVLLAKQSAKGETGKSPVLFGGLALGDLLLNAALPSFLGNNIVRGKSRLANKQGEQVASKTLTIRDDGRFANGYATSLFDGEGVPRQTTTIVENGKLRSFLWDSYWGQRHGESSTGNAARVLREGLVTIGMTNMVIPSGKTSLEDMIGDISSGYLVKGLQGAHSSNEETGDFSVVANPAFRIANGQITGAVHGLMLAGNIFDFFRQVEKIGSDVRPYFAGGSGALITPTLKLSDVQIVAKAD
ncbi:MAG: metallopeptidase TldD-related protein [Candidatus Hermodarchaeota archaeon]|nr:metallopeptidase TldD-related protein [Candidatus Hermodarchaeota archaeon]